MMTAFIAHLKKYRVFTVVFVVLLGIAFIYFSDFPYGPFPWLNLCEGLATGFVAALLFSWLYDSLVPDTFHLVAPLYYAVAAWWTTYVAFAWYGNIFFSVLLIVFSIAGVIAAWLFFKRLWGNWGALLFHLAGNFFWFVFVALYTYNIHSAYRGC